MPLLESLGEGDTPLVTWSATLRLKLEHLNPTGSFKDRGAARLVAAARAAGAERIVVDSSGNAGAAAAAYSARAGLACDVYVPASTSPGKIAQMAAVGAVIHPVEGSRTNAAVAAREDVATTGAFYASHVEHPAFVAGVAALAWELWDQTGPGDRPEAIVVPVGNGSLLLGVAAGLAELAEAGRLDRMPRLIGVQAEACAPIVAAWSGAELGGAGGQTIAEGIAIAEPRRRDDVVAAVRASGGEMLTVSDDTIAAAQADLARNGFWVEPSGAVSFAGWRARPELHGLQAVAVLTGHGFKALPQVEL